MKQSLILALFIIISFAFGLPANQDSVQTQISDLQKLNRQSEVTRISDSIRRADLMEQISLLNKNNLIEREKLTKEIREIEMKDSLRRVAMLERITSLKKTAIGYPVILFSDTLFSVYTKIGASTPPERARNISRRINKIYYDRNFPLKDSLMLEESDNNVDIVYGEMIIMSISETDALWYNKTEKALALDYSEKIHNAVLEARKAKGLIRIFLRIGLVILVVAGIWALIRLIIRGYGKLEEIISYNKGKWLRSLSYRNYTFFSVDQELVAINYVLKIMKWFLILLLLYLVLPIVFSIFPFTRRWATSLFNLIWSPFKGVLTGIWKFLPNLFSILVIVIVMRYFIRFVRYIFREIQSEKLRITGFHPDWAMPTFSIVRFLLYAFMFVLIFPYLPGSDSGIFKGVSVFVGVLFSLGSTSAIANMVAGLVITYMRPFKIGDRITIGQITGDVVEKTLLVTRLRTIKNEEVTIPNSSVLSGNTVNYSMLAKMDGLILHTSVTIGYDVPWREMHKALIQAALKTDMILEKPEPFVLQTSLDDFYVTYQLNAYTKEPNKQASIYSELHKNIQDVCNETGIEIMSPHYSSVRDGNTTAVPSDYLKDGYRPPSFRVDIQAGAVMPGNKEKSDDKAG
jgi:small-conductance mechanosensitive channel